MRVVACFALSIVCCGSLPAAEEVAFPQESQVDRVWIGPDFWANRLQDWRLDSGRIACVAQDPGLGFRTLHLLTRDLARGNGEFTLRMRIGLLNRFAGNVADDSAAGFLLGAGAPGMDYRSAALIHGAAGPGAGCLIGLTARGRVIVEDRTAAKPVRQFVARIPQGTNLKEGVVLELSGRSTANGRVTLHMSVIGPDGSIAAEHRWEEVDGLATFGGDLGGGVALVSHPGGKQPAKFGGRWWFDDVSLAGDRVATHPERRLGPILSTQYTVSRGTLKLSAQFFPIGRTESHRAALQVARPDGTWKTVAETQIAEPSYVALFRDDEWDATIEDRYRVVYPAEAPPDEQHTWSGVIRRDPVDKPTIVVAGFTGNHNNAHGFARNGYDFLHSIWFPHADVTRHVDLHKPDLLFFSGDQVYEGDSPTFADTSPDNLLLDYLYKWYLWCWAYRDLTRDIPSICEPDDHDVFQGNLWGQSGRRPVPGTDRYLPAGVAISDPAAPRDHDGGYVHPAEFVKLVDATQTSHLPDPAQQEPNEQGIGSYYTRLVWGRIGVAILEDRKFKSGCNREDLPPSGTGRPDHFNDPEFDVARLDVPGAQLLGKRQLQFLNEFAEDWRGQDLKLAVSQTIFANMATHHGPKLERLIADLDSNGWPQTGRNKAVEALRKGFMFHLAGDQHLATIVHHGIAAHGDAVWSFCVPSVANFYPRAWAPEDAGSYSNPPPERYTGPRFDGFGHPVIVYAASNPGADMQHEPRALHDKMPGYGIVKLNKADRTITMECWPRFADPTDPSARQYPGWPKTISQFDNDMRTPMGYLAEIHSTVADPVVQVLDAATGQSLSAVRIRGTSYRVPVHSAGTYRVIVSTDEASQTFDSLTPSDSPPALEAKF